MRALHHVFIAGLLGSSALCATPVAVYAQSTECPVAAVSSEEAPPPLPDYDQPPPPAAGYLWTPGYWNWNNEEYYWVPGTWVEPPEPGLLWTPGYWGYSNGAYLFHRGYWGPHVGFYGGVAYGFGYSGSGFEGGYWDRGQYFYNRSVTNLGNVRITNVYNKMVIINRNAARISYNGGASGIIARPTPEQEAIAREHHIPPTRLQVENTRAASRNEALFVSANHGKPAIAATARPGDFKGPAVVPARAAGGPITPARGAEVPRTEGNKPLEQNNQLRGGENKFNGGKPPAENPPLRTPESVRGKELENKPLGQPGAEKKTPPGFEEKRVPGQTPETKRLPGQTPQTRRVPGQAPETKTPPAPGEQRERGRKPTEAPNLEKKPVPGVEERRPPPGREERKLPSERGPQGERPEARRPAERPVSPQAHEATPRSAPQMRGNAPHPGGVGPGHAPGPEGRPKRPGEP